VEKISRNGHVIIVIPNPLLEFVRDSKIAKIAEHKI